MILELRNITRKYASAAGTEPRTVLHDLSLQITDGESIAISGPSGSGKSTLLNIMGNLDRPTSGEVFFENQNLADFSESKLAEFRNQKLGFVFQLHHLLPQCTVLENVLLPTLAFPGYIGQQEMHNRAMELLEKVGLRRHSDQRPGQLSGGEQQRVAVVRALINKPRLLLADEPTGSLDQESAEKLAELLVSLKNNEGLTLIVVTHALQLAERMDKTYKLINGNLEF